MSSRSLPSHIASVSRSHLAGRSRPEDGDTAGGGVPSSRMPLGKNSNPQGLPHKPSRDTTHTTRTNSSSTTSSSISNTSLLERMKAPSSRTSLEDNYEEPSKQGRGWVPVRGRKAMPLADDQIDEANTNKGLTESNLGYGNDLWGRVTAVASQLTVNVSQAWQKSVQLADGEETPPGQESRLTKAMKAYHLDRARSTGDLPPWLFDEQERGVIPKSWNNSREYEDRFLPDGGPPETPQRSGLRDVFDRAAASSLPTVSSASQHPGGEAERGSRATNRLKAIRDAKRSALQPRTESQPASTNRHRDMKDTGDDERHSQERSVAPARIGLPAGPGRMRRG